MRVLYDISILGIGYHSVLDRAGIFRFSEELLQQLLHSQQCELGFYSGKTVHPLVQNYLKQNPLLKNKSVLTGGSKALGAFNTLLYGLYRQLGIPLTSQSIKFPLIPWWFEADYFAHLDSPDLQRFDIYHSPIYPLPKPDQHRNIQRFLTVHDLVAVLYPQYCTSMTVHRIQKALNSVQPDDRVIAVSQSVKEDLIEHFKMEAERIFVVHEGASDLFYPCTDEQRWQRIKQTYNLPESPFFLSVNTLEPRKNMGQVIRCFAKLVQQEKLKEMKLVLVGSKGWKTQGMYDVLSALPEVEKHVVMPGYIPHEDLAPIYSRAQGFIYPSMYEGFGLPVLEAMQCGVPVIVSNRGSLPEVVGDTGVVLEPDDQDGLCQAMLNLIESKDSWQQLREQSLQQAQQFSWQKTGEKVIQAYKVALGVPGQKPPITTG